MFSSSLFLDSLLCWNTLVSYSLVPLSCKPTFTYYLFLDLIFKCFSSSYFVWYVDSDASYVVNETRCDIVHDVTARALWLFGNMWPEIDLEQAQRQLYYHRWNCFIRRSWRWYDIILLVFNSICLLMEMQMKPCLHLWKQRSRLQGRLSPRRITLQLEMLPWKP